MSNLMGSSRVLKLGLVVNPVAGLGGAAGLKGSDSRPTQLEALARGSKPRAEQQAIRLLNRLSELMPRKFRLLTAPGLMGESAAQGADISAQVIQTKFQARELLSTTAVNTIEAVRDLQKLGTDLLLFVGGDGTARDVFEALSADPAVQVVLGVPAGVKMQSAVFARSAIEAAVLVNDWSRMSQRTELAEVADIDEDARRQGILNSKLYGYLTVPRGKVILQGGKVGSGYTGQSLLGIATECRRWIQPDAMCLLAPGTTVQEVAKTYSGKSSLLGVDVLHRNRMIAADLPSAQLHEMTKGHRLQMVVSPVGGQGFLFGRGNQQLDAKLLERLDSDDLIIICTEEKLAQLRGGPLYIDVPEAETLERLTGYKKVITGMRQTASVLVKDARNI